MKIADLLLTLLTSSLLVVTQVLMKIWLNKYTIQILPLKQLNISTVFRYEFIIAGLSLIVSMLIWMSLLKKIDFSILYPLVSISYILGMLAAKYVFQEHIPSIRWLGVAFILVGVFIISRS